MENEQKNQNLNRFLDLNKLLQNQTFQLSSNILQFNVNPAIKSYMYCVDTIYTEMNFLREKFLSSNHPKQTITAEQALQISLQKKQSTVLIKAIENKIIEAAKNSERYIEIAYTTSQDYDLILTVFDKIGYEVILCVTTGVLGKYEKIKIKW